MWPYINVLYIYIYSVEVECVTKIFARFSKRGFFLLYKCLVPDVPMVPFKNISMTDILEIITITKLITYVQNEKNVVPVGYAHGTPHRLTACSL